MPAIKNAHIRYRIIDRCLRNKFRPYPTKEDLRSTCEEALFGSEDGSHISDSTIEKDLFAMREEMDAPIRYSKIHKGYYYEDENFSINDIPLSDEEIESLKFASHTLMQFKDAAIFQQFGFAIDKIFDRIAASDEFDNEDSEIIQFEKGFSSQGNEYLPDLLEAIKHRLIVTFVYESFISGVSKARKVVPILLKEYRNRWYLIVFDLDKSDIITYALERMENLKVTKDVYSSEINFSANDFFKYSTGITAGSKKVETIIFKADAIAAKYIQSQPFHFSQKEIDNKNGSTFSLEVIISEELIRELMSYGGEIEILQPAILREKMAERFAKAVKIYSK